MNQEMIEGFMKRAEAAGLTRKQASDFLAKNFGGQVAQKTASQNDSLDKFVSGILKQASVEKSTASVAYTQGILKSATEKGYDLNAAAELAKIALAQNNGFKKIAAPQPSADEQQKYYAYVDGFMKASCDYGFTEGQSVDLLNYTIKQSQLIQKNSSDSLNDPSAAGPGGMPPGADPSAGGMPPGGDPSAAGGAPGGDPAAQALEAAIAQHPELAQVILQLLQSQQGQQGGPGADPSAAGGTPPPDGGDGGMFKQMAGGQPPQAPGAAGQ